MFSQAGQRPSLVRKKSSPWSREPTRAPTVVAGTVVFRFVMGSVLQGLDGQMQVERARIDQETRDHGDIVALDALLVFAPRSPMESLFDGSSFSAIMPSLTFESNGLELIVLDFFAYAILVAYAARMGPSLLVVCCTAARARASPPRPLLTLRSSPASGDGQAVILGVTLGLSVTMYLIASAPHAHARRMSRDGSSAAFAADGTYSNQIEVRDIAHHACSACTRRAESGRPE